MTKEEYLVRLSEAASNLPVVKVSYLTGQADAYREIQKEQKEKPLKEASEMSHIFDNPQLVSNNHQNTG